MRSDTGTSTSPNGLHRADSRNARAAAEGVRVRLYTPCSRSSQYSKYRASGSIGTPAATASTIEAPSRNSVSFGSASCAHSSISSAK